MTKPAVEQEWLAHEVTPAGLEIRYGVKPKRVYQIRKGPKGRWKTVPSVTTCLDELKAEGLVWWGQRVGVEGVLSLFDKGLLVVAQNDEGVVLAYEEHVPQVGPLVMGWDDDGNSYTYNEFAPDLVRLATAGTPQIEELLKANQLTVNHMRDQAGDRGQNVHDAFEAWAKDPALLPDPSLFPAHEAGYVAGLLKFIQESKAKPLAAEVQVGSAKHGFAGRYDIRLELPEDVELVVHHTPVRGEKRELFAAGIYLGDLKTSKRPYPKNALQLAAYELASIECGYAATLGRSVIQVSAEGAYRFVRCKATGKDFLQVLRLWKTMQGAKEWLG